MWMQSLYKVHIWHQGPHPVAVPEYKKAAEIGMWQKSTPPCSFCVPLLRRAFLCLAKVTLFQLKDTKTLWDKTRFHHLCALQCAWVPFQIHYDNAPCKHDIQEIQQRNCNWQTVEEHKYNVSCSLVHPRIREAYMEILWLFPHNTRITIMDCARTHSPLQP